MSGRCEFTELPEEQCAHCLGHRTAASEREQLGDARWVGARYPGRCASCGEPFDVDDQIRAAHDGWISECCEEEL